nr:hypothetical protein [Antheraea pernyi nucleopolyhedrovirus]
MYSLENNQHITPAQKAAVMQHLYMGLNLQLKTLRKTRY